MILEFFANAIIDLVFKLTEQNRNELEPTPNQVRNEPEPTPKTAEELLDYLVEENKTSCVKDLLASLTKEDHKILRAYLHSINPPRKRPTEYYRIRLNPVEGGRKFGNFVEVTFREPPVNDDKDEPPRQGSTRN